MTQHKRLDHAVRMFYDLQKLRIQSGQRAKMVQTELTDKDKIFLDTLGGNLKDAEDITLKRIKQELKGIPIYEQFLKKQVGCGPTMAGVILSRIDIHRAPAVSNLWSFCGLGVDPDGKAQRLKAGEKARYSPFLKTKIVQVLGTSFVKAHVFSQEHGQYCTTSHRKNPDDPEGPRVLVYTPVARDTAWRRFYDDYKHRKESQVVTKCAGCKGTGYYKASEKEKKVAEWEGTDSLDGKRCSNCQGTGGPAPWGRSAAHRQRAALRYMMKMFLQQLYVEWRTLEGLPVRKPYQEEYLGHKH